MAPVKNGRVIFNEIPTGYPVPGKTTVYDDSETIDLDKVPLNGGFLVKTLVVSIDPYLRGKMRDSKIQSYQRAFYIGEPIENFAVGVVLRSENDAVKVGQHVYGVFPFQEYFVRAKFEGVRIIENKEGLPWTLYVGVAGMPGKTAWHAWHEYSAAKPGDTVFVSAGAGPVGSMVIQIAKKAGLRVIASAGSEEKVNFVKSIGADVVFNYKTTKTLDVLQKEGPIDVYWDNVGGETLDAALQSAKTGARFIECGMISGYNEKAAPVNNLMQIVSRSLRIFGFIVSDLAPKYEEAFYQTVPAQIARGEFKYLEDVVQGLEQAGDAILAVQKGTNRGKSVIVVAKE